MAGFLDQFRKKVVASVWKEVPDEPEVRDIDDKIALGVLLWVVAEADEQFRPEEEAKIKEVLKTYAKISESDIPYVMTSIQEAARERIDLYRFTHEVSQDLPYDKKVSVVEILFRVACADKDLDSKEIETVRKIARLFHLSHRDFIDAKLKVALNTTRS